MLDLDGDGPSPARLYYCDMTNGGWTLIANQVPSLPLPNLTDTVNADSFGRIDQTYRLGTSEVKMLRPSRAWKMTDDSNSVYFKPTCIVDWTLNYSDVTAATDCTTGYTNAMFDTVVNGQWMLCSARGIGINNSGSSCSMRMYEAQFNAAGMPQGGARSAGVATPCLYNDTSQRVSLWFQ